MKENLKLFWDEFIHGGHLIALGNVTIVLSFVLLIGKNILFPPLLIIYLLGFTALLYNRYKEEKTDVLVHPERTETLKKYFKKMVLAIIFSIAISVLILIINGQLYALAFTACLYIFSILYTLYFKNLTNIYIGFKNFHFSLMISLLLIFISLYYSYNFINLTFLLIFIFIFLRVFVSNVFLDIKDVKNDSEYNLKTFPIVFGPQKTIFFLKIITLISGLLIIFGIVLKIIPIYSLMLLFVIPYTFYYFEKSKKKENFYLVNYVLADAEFILWPISIIIGKIVL